MYHLFALLTWGLLSSLNVHCKHLHRRDAWSTQRPGSTHKQASLQTVCALGVCGCELSQTPALAAGPTWRWNGMGSGRAKRLLFLTAVGERPSICLVRVVVCAGVGRNIIAARSVACMTAG